MRPNNLDLTRLVLALIVFLAHCYVVSAQPRLSPLQYFPGPFAVQGFFSLSGLLIFASYERSKSVRDYFVKRALRILPAYWLSTVLCLGIAYCFSRALYAGKFLTANLTFLNFLALSIPGVFEHNPHNSVMNGALWTIKIEVAFYLVVPLMFWLCRRFGANRVLVLTIALSIAYRLVVAPYNFTLSYQFPGQLCFFCAGALTYFNLGKFRTHGFWISVIAVALYGVFLRTEWFILEAVSVPVIVLGFGLLLPEIKGLTRWGDFSYGIYVLHWPILQTVVALGFFDRSPLSAFVASALLVFLSAAASWFLIERPCLAYAHRLTGESRARAAIVPENVATRLG